MAADSYREAARRNFEALRKLYKTNDDLDCQAAVSFCRLGNAFDTMIDYLDVIDRTGATDPNGLGLDRRPGTDAGKLLRRR